MIKNNLVALGLLLVVDIAVYAGSAWVDSWFQFHWNSVAILPDAVLTLVMAWLFWLVGRYALRELGSALRNAASFGLVFVLGSAIAIQYAAWNPQNGVDLLTGYYGYSAPLVMLYLNLTGSVHGIFSGTLQLIPVRLLSSCMLTVIPCLLMWFGIGSKKRFNDRLKAQPEETARW